MKVGDPVIIPGGLDYAGQRGTILHTGMDRATGNDRGIVTVKVGNREVEVFAFDVKLAERQVKELLNR